MRGRFSPKEEGFPRTIMTTNKKTEEKVMMTKDDIISVLIDEAEYDEQEVMGMSNYELIDKWLTWEGIIGYTEDIISAVLDVHGVELNDEETEL